MSARNLGGSLMSSLGFEKGVPIEVINGRRLTSPDAAFEAKRSAQVAKQNGIVLQRKGKTLTFHYAVS